MAKNIFCEFLSFERTSPSAVYIVSVDDLQVKQFDLELTIPN